MDAGRLALLLLLLSACRGPSPSPPTLDWLLGDWQGVRRDASDGTEAPMTVHVESLSEGRGQVERIQVSGAGTPYVGFAVRVPSDTSGRWLMLYTNMKRETFARLEGRIETDRVTWDSVTPGRTRESRLVMERLDDSRCKRTQRFSEDGGSTWKVMFTDELERKK